MRNFTKTIAMVLSIILSLSLIASYASENAVTNSAEVSVAPQAFYNSYTGTVKEITDGENGLKTIHVGGKDGQEANFIISNNTYFVEGIKTVAGAEITGFYEAGKPMIMIYPPQYSIEIVAAVEEGKFIKADKFDSDLLSADKALKLNISDETEIVWENGTVINWFKKPTAQEIAAVLTNRKLIVIYDFMTKSIPAQTTPVKVIVLSQKEEPIYDVSGANIVVNGKKIEAPSAYNNESGIIMVPIRSIAEALGYSVSWNGQLHSVMVGNDVSIKIDIDDYIISGTTSIKLGTPPQIKNDRTFVPLNFFNEVLMKNATVVEGSILIDDNK